MVFDGLGRESQRISHGRIAHAAHQQVEHLTLAAGQAALGLADFLLPAHGAPPVIAAPAAPSSRRAAQGVGQLGGAASSST